jgi:cbb3-type cytochrome oxidase subunit 3
MKLFFTILFILILIVVIAFIFCAMKIASMVDNEKGDDKNDIQK